MSVTEYAVKFVELAKFYPHYTTEFSKCIKFENGLRAKIKQAIGYQKIRNFSELRMIDERRPRKKDAPVEIVCYTCGENGHKGNACPGDVKRCFRCGKKGNTLAECKHDDVICFNCNEEEHIGSQCKKPKKAQTTGRLAEIYIRDIVKLHGVPSSIV
ncbi:zinc finger protein GIS2-like [Medicago truncatula]|uniref:zinc finger protein GIS2-like n=1 Tax=Medicago truncatula TaxID=3880 RepID=UPI0019675B5D|nr:zinc finger protein GIS2-like [Medicago truncatula]